MIKQKIGTRCPRCKYENLAIDIWCARCGTPVDWQGAPAPSDRAGTGRRHGFPWLNGSQDKEDKARVSVAPVAAAPPPSQVAPAPVVAAPPPPQVAPAQPVAAVEPVADPVPVRPEPPKAAPAPLADELPVAAASAAEAKPADATARPSRPPRARTPMVMPHLQLPQIPSMQLPRMPRMQLPRMPRIRLPRMPRLKAPALTLPRMRVARVPMVAWIIGAVVLVLLVAPLAYVLSPSARQLVASRAEARPTPALAKTGPPVAGQATALAAAIPGVEAKTGLKYTSGSCAANTACLKLISQSTGLNAAAIQFSTAGSGGRQCVGYVYHDAAGWQFMNAACGLPGQLSPLVGSQATVRVPGQCANVRDAAGLQGSIIVCLNDGTTVRVDGGPNYADGKIWWHLEKNGWMAHDFLVS